ncbi:5613_t:CDS:1, partial [Funneliformis caledonium]
EMILHKQFQIKYPNKSIKEIEEVLGRNIIKGPLDLSVYSDLEKFTVFNNITNINVSKNIKLKFLELPFSEISRINLSNNINLQRLQLGNEKLTSLDLSKNPQFKESDYGTNKLLLNKLPKDKIIFFNNNTKRLYSSLLK